MLQGNKMQQNAKLTAVELYTSEGWDMAEGKRFIDLFSIIVTYSFTSVALALSQNGALKWL